VTAPPPVGHRVHYRRKHMKYFVTIQAVIRKTIEVEAETRADAVESAHELFTVENDGPEYYNEETINVEELK